MKTFQAENGEKVVARDEIQAAAFKNAGFKEVKEPRKREEK